MTISDLQSQVELMVQHSGLANKVIGWANRTCQDIATRAFWSRQLGIGFAGHTNLTSASHTVSAANHQFTFATPNTDTNVLGEFIAPFSVDQVTLTGTSILSYARPLIRLEAADLYAQARGGIPTAEASATSSFYAVVRGTADTSSTTGGGTVSEYFVGYPFPAATGTTQQMAISYAGAPVAMTDGTGTNWLMQRYPRVVLAGVLRFARLYLGDPVGYMQEKAEFENGIADMLKSEEAPAANTPVMRGVDAGALGRIV